MAKVMHKQLEVSDVLDNTFFNYALATLKKLKKLEDNLNKSSVIQKNLCHNTGK